MKHWKRWSIVAGGGFVAIVALAAAQEKPAGKPARSGAGAFEVAIPTAQEVRAMLGAYGSRVEEQEKALVELRKELASTREQLGAAIQASAQERRQELGALGELLQGSKQEAQASTGRFRIFEFGRPEAAKRMIHVPAGSFGEGTLLTGVFAPTTGEPLPVLVRLDSALVGPQQSRVPIRGAFVVGKASGDANSKRAIVQLDTLSTLRPDGTSVEARVNGWAVDDDGVQGLRGEYVWRADEIAALAIMAGGLGAGADAFAARESTSSVTPLGGSLTTVTGDPLKFAGGRALGETARKFGEIVTARLNEITPAVHVANGKRISVAFISGVTLEGLEVAHVDGETDPYRGLDDRR